MPYDATNDPYTHKDTGVLLNLLGIDDGDELNVAEAEITTVNIATIQLPKSYKLTDFTKSLFLELHKEIFSDIYTWAGELRTIDVSKESSYFAHTEYINPQLTEMFTKLTSDGRLLSTDKSEFTYAIAFYYSELNAIHPFREGNGRIIRTFLRLLAINRAWNIDWSELDGKENIRVCRASFVGDLTPLYEMLLPMISRL